MIREKHLIAETRTIPWNRIAVEAAAINAWWDARVEHNRSVTLLNTISAEYAEVERQLQLHEKKLLKLRQAVSSLLPHIGPDALMQPTDSLYSLIDLSFRASQIELPMSSLQALLVSGELSAVSGNKLKALLVAWPAQVSRLRTSPECSKRTAKKSFDTFTTRSRP
jgi:hypothetical protein